MAIFTLMFVDVALAAPPKIDSVFPIGARRGHFAPLTLTGEFPQCPPEIWCDRTDVAITCEAEKGKLLVNASKAERGGFVRFRLLGKEGVSSLQTIHLGEYSEFTEIEPNHEPNNSNALTAPITINGRLSEKNDVDVFRVDLKAGDALTAALQAHSVFGAPIDAVLQACRLVQRPPSALGEEPAEAFVLAQNHDGLGLDPVLRFTAPSDGTYLVRLFAFPSSPDSTIGYFSSPAAAYRLTLTCEAFDSDSLLPIEASRLREVKVAPGNHDPIETPPFTLIGEFRTPDAEFTIPFTAVKKSKLTFAAQSRELGSRADLRFEVLDAEGKKLVSGDQADPRKSTETAFVPPADGTYLLRVRELFSRGGEGYRFRLAAIGANQEFEINAAKETFAFAGEAPLEIPLTIDRRFGFAGAIEIEASKLPAGVMSEKAVSEEKGESAKSVKLKLTRTAEAKPGTYRFAITGRSGDGTIIRPAEYSTGRPLDVKQRDFWLTIPAR